MTELKFRKSLTRIVGINILLQCFPILIFLVLIGRMVMFAGTEDNQAKSNSSDYFAYLFAVIWMVVCGWLAVKALSVKFTDEGVWQKMISGWNFIAWRDITFVEDFQYTISIYQNQNRILVFVGFYADADEVLSFIQKRLPESK